MPRFIETPVLGAMNALQWRLQFGRVLQEAGITLGIEKIR